MSASCFTTQVLRERVRRVPTLAYRPERRAVVLNHAVEPTLLHVVIPIAANTCGELPSTRSRSPRPSCVAPTADRLRGYNLVSAEQGASASVYNTMLQGSTHAHKSYG